MKKKFLLKVASAILSSGILISLIPSAVLADGDTITVDGHDFVKQSDGLYKCSLTMYEYWAGSAHPYTYSYCLLTQEIINKDFGGTLPSVVNPTTGNYYYYLGEDITIHHGVKAQEKAGSLIELQGRTITFDPEDNSEYLFDGSDIMSCSIKLQDSYFSGDPGNSLRDGKIYSPNGAPIARINGENGNNTSSVYLGGVKVIGGYGTNYDDKRYSAFDLSGYSKLYVGIDASISYFSADKGGAVYARENTTVDIEGKIAYCYATEGGGVYSEGRVTYSGQMADNTADKRGGAICLIGDNARFESTYCSDEVNPLPRIYFNTCNSCEGEDEGGGGIYVDSGYERPVDLDDKVYIYNNSTNGGTKKNLHIICDDLKDYIYVDYYNDDEFKVGISAYGLKDGDPLIRVLSYASTTGTSYYTDRFIYETSDNSILKTNVYKNPDNDNRYILDFCYVSDKKNTTVLSGYSLITDGTSIGIRFYVYFSDADRNYGYTKFTAKVSTVGDNECYLLGNNEKTLTYRDGDYEGSYYTYTYYVDSMDMTVPLSFELYKSGKEEPIASMSGFTVRDYIDAVVKNPIKYGESGVKMATCLALYGAASQKYFNFRSDDLADKNITDDLKSKATLSWNQNNYKNTVFYDPSDTQNGSNMPFSVAPSEHLTFYGWTMSFKGKPALKFYFLPEEGVTIDDLYIYSYPANKKIYTKGKYIVIELYDLTMEQVTSSSYFTIYFGEDYETELEIYFKPINYITRMMKKDNNTAEANALFESFYLLAMQFLPDYFENYYY